MDREGTSKPAPFVHSAKDAAPEKSFFPNLNMERSQIIYKKSLALKSSLSCSVIDGATEPRGSPMPQISTQEFERLPLRVHNFLAGVPLHDVWAVDLPRTRSGITLDEFSRVANACLC